MSTAPRSVHFIDGWYTDDPAELRTLMRAPGSWTYRAQLAVDARSWKPWAWWLMGVAPPVAAWLHGSDRGVLLGLPWCATVFYKYVHMLRRVVSDRRRAKLIEGVVQQFDARHPLFRTFLAGEFTTREPLGERVRAILPEWAVRSHARPDGSMDVLVAHAPGAEFSHVVGFRGR